MNAVLTNADERLTLSPMSKEELIYTRISTALKNRLAIEAHNRGEAEAVIVREALNEYFVHHRAESIHDAPNSTSGLVAAKGIVDLAAARARAGATAPPGTAKPVNYRAARRSKRKPSA